MGEIKLLLIAGVAAEAVFDAVLHVDWLAASLAEVVGWNQQHITKRPPLPRLGFVSGAPRQFQFGMCCGFGTTSDRLQSMVQRVTESWS